MSNKNKSHFFRQIKVTLNELLRLKICLRYNISSKRVAKSLNIIKNDTSFESKTKKFFNHTNLTKIYNVSKKNSIFILLRIKYIYKYEVYLENFQNQRVIFF